MRRTTVAAVLVAAPLVALAVPTSLGKTSGHSTYQPQVVAAAKSAFERAAVVSQQVSVPVESPGKSQTAAMLEALRARGERWLAEVYEGPALQQERQALANAIAAERDPSFRVLDGGVRRFEYQQITVVSDAQVVVSARVWEWWRVAQVPPGGGAAVASTKESVMDARATVGKGADGSWRVGSFTWRLVDGAP